jgi:ribosomal protein S6E (S10)
MLDIFVEKKGTTGIQKKKMLHAKRPGSTFYPPKRKRRKKIRHRTMVEDIRRRS